MSSPALSTNKLEAFQAVVPGVAGQSEEVGLTHFKNFTNTASDTLPFHANCTLIELFATQDCWVVMKPSTSSEVAAVPTESLKTLSKWVPGGIVCFLGVPKKDGVLYKLSVVRDSSNGRLYCTEGA